MTDAVQVVGQSRMTSWLQTVYWLQQYLLKFADEAGKCQLNHSFYGRASGKARELPFLDCDFLWSSIRIQDAMSRVQAARQRRDQDVPALVHRMTAWGGPHTIRYLMDGMARSGRPYAIPPGALAELFRRKEALFGKLSKQSKKLLERFDGPKPRDPHSNDRDAGAPAMVVELVKANLSKELVDGLRKEITSLDTMYDDAEVLDRILGAATHVGDLLGNVTPDVGKSYRVTLSMLRHERPELTNNNFADALNVAALVWLFRSPGDGGGRRRFPVLVTNTAAVAAAMTQLQSELPLPNPHEAGFLQSPLYLVMSQAFTERNSTPAEVANEAQAFVYNLQPVLGACRDVIQLPSSGAAMRRLQNRLLGFVNRFSDTFDPLRRFPILDHASRANALLSPEVDRLLNVLSRGDLPDTQANMIVALRNDLVEQLRRHDVVRELLTASAEVVSVHSGSPPDIYRETLFELSTIEPERRVNLLKNQQPGAPLGPSLHWDPARDIRFVAAFKDAPRYGALLVADYTVRTSGPELAVRFTHNADLRLLVPAFFRAGKRFAALSETPTIQLNLFGGEESVHEELVAETATPAAEFYAVCTKHDYLEVLTGEVGLYADIEPLAGKERQLGIVAPLKRWSGLFVREIEDLADEMRISIPPAHLAWMIREMLRRMRSAEQP